MARSTQRIQLKLGHSPDPDDAFMWWPLLELDGQLPRLDTGRFRFESVMEDIESLNQRARNSELEITAISCASYPGVKDQYAFTSCGASLGMNYGPKIVARQPMSLADLTRSDVIIAVPGTGTSAFAATSLMLGVGLFQYEVVPFDAIIDRVVQGDFSAGVLIHEGQLTFEKVGLHLVADLGAWWYQRHQLPLPLGGNVILRSLKDRFGSGTLQEITALLRQSVDYAMLHRTDSLAYASQFARDMEADQADTFIGMYVNKWTLDFGDTGLTALRTFLKELHEAGIVSDPGEVVPIAGM